MKLNFSEALNIIEKAIDEKAVEYENLEYKAEKIELIENILDSYLKDETDTEIAKSEILEII